MKGFSVCLFVLLVSGALQLSDAQTCNTTLTEFISNRTELSTLRDVIVQTGLADNFNDSSLNVTVFAPNNAAMAGLLEVLAQVGLNLSSITNVSNNVAASVILYHVVTVPATAAQLTDGQVLQTLLTPYNLTVDRNATTVEIDGVESDATVVTADLAVCNSYVHIIDDVLLPAELGDIPPYVSPAPGTPPSPPGTVTPPATFPTSAATKIGSQMLIAAVAAIAAVLPVYL